MSSSIPQGTKDYIGTASKTMFNREHIRPVTVFFGIGEERPFYVEKSPSLLMARLRHNTTFFYLNYMLMFAVLFMLTLFISPSAIIGIGLLGLAWLYVIRASQDGNLKFYGTSAAVLCYQFCSVGLETNIFASRP
jgi:PRA1 family protein